MASKPPAKTRGQKRSRPDDILDALLSSLPAKRVAKASDVTIEGDTIICRDLDADSSELLDRYSRKGPKGEWIGPNKVKKGNGTFLTIASNFWERTQNQPDNTITADEIETLSRVAGKLNARAENAVGELETARREIVEQGRRMAILKDEVETEKKEKAELREEVARLRTLNAELKLSDAKTQAENAKLYSQVIALEKAARSA